MTDPAECDHPSFDHDGGTDWELDTIYVGATCTECGASASAVHPCTHYLVFEEPDATPVEVVVQ